MIDENAFGALISYYDIENDEYGLEPEQFAARWREFRRIWQECLGIFRLGEGVTAVDLGHALYVEVGEGDQSEDPIVWLKMIRSRLAEKGYPTVGVVTHGGRWSSSDEPTREAAFASNLKLTVASGPSEALRRALYAETGARYDEDDAPDGWGPGLYADAEALAALGRTFKNEPTPLLAGGATFYRVAK